MTVYVVPRDYNCWDDAIDSIWTTKEAAEKRSLVIHIGYKPWVEEFNLDEVHED